MSVVSSKLPKLWRYFGPKKRGPKMFLLISVLNWTILRRRTNSPCVDQFFPVDPVSKQRGENWISPMAYMHAQNAKLCTSQNIWRSCAQISVEKCAFNEEEVCFVVRSMRSVYFCLCTVNTLCAYLCACTHLYLPTHQHAQSFGQSRHKKCRMAF